MLNKHFFNTKKAVDLMNQTPTMNTILYWIKGGFNEPSPYDEYNFILDKRWA
jgi:hypothetical protein